MKDYPSAYFFVGFLSSLTVGYFLCKNFRENISSAGIDATLVTGLITTLALIFSLIHNTKILKENSRDRNFAYRMAVKTTFEQMGLNLISRMYFLNGKRETSIKAMEHIKEALKTGREYRDGYGIRETDMDSTSTAILTVYFPHQGDNWNKVIEIVSEMGSIAKTTLLNYEENDYGKKSCQWLTDIDIHIARIKELDRELGETPQHISNAIIEEINTHTQNLTKI